jgi:hypothetical protein
MVAEQTDSGNSQDEQYESNARYEENIEPARDLDLDIAASLGSHITDEETTDEQEPQELIESPTDNTIEYDAQYELTPEEMKIVSVASVCLISRCSYIQRKQLSHLLKTECILYWALLVEHVSDVKYKRVGICLLYRHALEDLGAKVQEFEIV